MHINRKCVFHKHKPRRGFTGICFYVDVEHRRCSVWGRNRFLLICNACGVCYVPDSTPAECYSVSTKLLCLRHIKLSRVGFAVQSHCICRDVACRISTALPLRPKNRKLKQTVNKVSSHAGLAVCVFCCRGGCSKMESPV